MERPDPRLFQIAALGMLLAIGIAGRAFPVEPIDLAAIFTTALLTQWVMSLVFAIRFEARSAIITSLALSLLLRADGIMPLIAAAALAIGSKFILRWNGKHLFNPANIGIVATTLATSAAWTTPGQWGTAIWLAAIIAGAGFFVTYRVSRLDVPLVFLGTLAALTIARALWLGDPLSIPLLRLQNGALILFAFFMISDPKTTPDGALPRAAFAAAAALITFVFTYNFFESDGVFYSLAILCAIRPLFELFDRAKRFEWSDAKARPSLQAPPAPAE